MNDLKIRIEIVGTWCNEWPRFRITANNTIYFDELVNGRKIIEFTILPKDTNELILQHYDKRFGENGIPIQMETFEDE